MTYLCKFGNPAQSSRQLQRPWASAFWAAGSEGQNEATRSKAPYGTLLASQNRGQSCQSGMNLSSAGVGATRNQVAEAGVQRGRAEASCRRHAQRCNEKDQTGRAAMWWVAGPSWLAAESWSSRGLIWVPWIGNRAPVHRTIQNCSICFQGACSNNSARLPIHDGCGRELWFPDQRVGCARQ